MPRKSPNRPAKTRNAVGAALRHARKSKGLSQAALTAKLQLFGWNIDRTSWVRIEMGERALCDAELIAVADVLGISMDAILASADRNTVRFVLETLDR